MAKNKHLTLDERFIIASSLQKNLSFKAIGTLLERDCEQLKSCTLEKHFYHAAAAYTEYKDILSESRSGITYSEQEIQHLDSVISPLILKGQSLNHICANNQDSIMCSRRTLYRLVDYNLFSARNIDLPRKVRYKARKKKRHFKVDRACRHNRTYADFKNFKTNILSL